MAEILCDMGRPDEGIDVILADPIQITGPHAALALCYARSGRIEEARAILAQLLEPPAGAYAQSYFPALVHIGLGDQEKAIDFLERAVEERVAALVWLGVRPVHDPLRDHPRFKRLLHRLRLPDLGSPT